VKNCMGKAQSSLDLWPQRLLGVQHFEDLGLWSYRDEAKLDFWCFGQSGTWVLKYFNLVLVGSTGFQGESPKDPNNYNAKDLATLETIVLKSV
jgi:hypothetical protein